MPLALEFSKRRAVVGYDVDENRVCELRNGIDRTRECAAAELERAKNLSYSSDEDCLDLCDVYIVTVPTPIDSTNRPDLTPLQRDFERQSVGTLMSVM